MPVAVTMIGTDVTTVPGAGPSVAGPEVEDGAAELVAHEHVLRRGRAACGRGRACPPCATPTSIIAGGVVDVVEVAAADAAGGDLDEHLALPRHRVVDVVADEHRPVAQHC